MPNYIDISKVTIPKGFFNDLNVPKLYEWLESQPTEDVVPRSDVEELTKENESLAKTVNEASELIRKLRSENNCLKAYDEERDIQLHQRLVREAKQEFAMEIISEFKNMVINYMKDRDLLLVAFKNAVAYVEVELKKKYKGKDTDVPTNIGE